MSTNYYLHIGKTIGQGRDHPPAFLAATDIEHLDANAGRLGWVLDEYGNDVPWSEFIKLYRRCELDDGKIGHTFS